MDKLGFIPLWRKFQNDPLWKERRKFSKAEAWIDIIWEVRHEQEPIEIIIKNTVLVCNRGESLYSLDTWAKRWKWSRSAIQRFFILLKKVGKIDTQSEQQTTRLTVCNYDKYNYARYVNDKQMKSKRKVNEKQVNTNNKDNNVNNDNNKAWRDSLTIYLKEEEEAYNTLIKDTEYINTLQKMLPSVDILATIEKSHLEYWNTPEGWEKKKKTKSKIIDWKGTFRNACKLSWNQIPKDDEEDIPLFDQEKYEKKILAKEAEKNKK